MAHFGKGYAVDCETKIKKRLGEIRASSYLNNLRNRNHLDTCPPLQRRGSVNSSLTVQNLLGNSRSRFNSTEWFLKKLERRINR